MNALLETSALCALALFPLSAASAQRQAPSRPVTLSVGAPTLRIAVIGDYGVQTTAAAAVAQLVQSAAPDLVFTVGGNNYSAGEATTIDDNVGQYYSNFLFPYLGSYTPGVAPNRFFPALGDRDWATAGATPYLDYFTLPGNERYYVVNTPEADFFVLSSFDAEPDGITRDSVQALWLETELAASTAPFQVVLFHHAPFSSSATNGPNVFLQWPFAEWGADLVLSGDNRHFERIERDGITYVVNGSSGVESLYPIREDVAAGSASRFAQGHGALFVDFDATSASLRFLRADGLLVDHQVLPATPAAQPREVFAGRNTTWRYNDLGVLPGIDWMDPGFDDSTWALGDAHFGYGDGDEQTLIGFGPDPDNKPITTWFRRSFDVALPGEVTELWVDAVFDDALAVWLNGTRVVLENLPPVYDETTLSVRSRFGPSESTALRLAVDPALLVAGTNVIAAEVHQVQPDSSDLSFDLELWGQRNGEVLVPDGSDWRYLDAGQVAPLDWAQPAFDDTSWGLGPAELGYGEGNEATLIYGTPIVASPRRQHFDRYFLTSYFRHGFTVAKAASIQKLEVRLMADDGAVLYVNGVEAARRNLPTGPITRHTAAGFDVRGVEETRFSSFDIDPALLVNGPNVIAVEVHQSSTSSNDLSFDLELVGRP